MKKLLVLLATVLVLFCSCDSGDGSSPVSPVLNSFNFNRLSSDSSHQDSFSLGDILYMHIEYTDSDLDACSISISFTGPAPLIPAVNVYPLTAQDSETEKVGFLLDTGILAISAGEYIFEACVEDSLGNKSNTVSRVIEIN